MRLFIIKDTESAAPKSSLLFLEAAKSHGVTAEYVSADKTDYFTLPHLEAGDALYRIGLSKRSAEIERWLLRDDIAHIHDDINHAITGRTSSYFYNLRAGLPVIPTIPLLPTTESNLDVHVEYLSGFPLVVKAMGGTSGVGVMRVDSMESLRSVLDFVRSLSGTVLLRKYVEHQYQGRLVVVGERVVASYRNSPDENEFRTNVVSGFGNTREQYEFSSEVNETAVRAVRALGVNCGGVDILFGPNDEFYIAEVNTPFNLKLAQENGGVDVAGEIVAWLTDRAAELKS